MLDSATEGDRFAVEFSAFNGDTGLHEALRAGTDCVAVLHSRSFKGREAATHRIDGCVEFGSRVRLAGCRIGEDLADLVCGAEFGAFLVGSFLCFTVFEGDDLDAVADL